MPDAPKNKHRMVRFSDQRWDALGVSASDEDTDRAKVINALVAWWLREPGAKLPRRPERHAPTPD